MIIIYSNLLKDKTPKNKKYQAYKYQNITGYVTYHLIIRFTILQI